MATARADKKMNMARVLADRQFRALLESLPEVAIQGYDIDRRVVYWNDASTRLYGYTAQEAIGDKLENLLIPDAMREAVMAAHRAWMHGGQRIPASELTLQHKSGAPVPVFSQHIKLETDAGEPVMFCVDVDLSHDKQARQRLDAMVRYDQLTHLLSRQGFESAVDDQLKTYRRHHEQFAVLFFDLDGFSTINETQGYEQGDDLLNLVAARLRRHQHEGSLLARLCADEFVMAFPCTGMDVTAVVRRVLGEFDRRFPVGERKIQLNASLGISLFPAHATSANELLRCADAAKHRAKRTARGSYLFYDLRFRRDQLRQQKIADRLQNALESNEFVLHYQPKVDASSGRINSLEALLRWQPRTGETISPAEFIAIAERSNLIDQIGEWVVSEACHQQAQWRQAGLECRRIDINLSGKQLARKAVFRSLDTHIRKHRLAAGDIGIELTENVLIQASDSTLSELRLLHDCGMYIAIDDFGTGYSSLGYLRRFPLTAIKIDRGFVQGAQAQASDRAILEATVLIGHRLGLEVVAEGVECESQLELVRTLGCDSVQGFYFFKPMSSNAISRLLGHNSI